jgi:hypothetical protein
MQINKKKEKRREKDAKRYFLNPKDVPKSVFG